MGPVTKGLMIGLSGLGVRVDRYDIEKNNSIYISIPEKIESFGGALTEKHIERLRDSLRELFQNKSLRVFYKIRKGEYFTKEMGIQAANEMNDGIHMF